MRPPRASLPRPVRAPRALALSIAVALPTALTLASGAAAGEASTSVGVSVTVFSSCAEARAAGVNPPACAAKPAPAAAPERVSQRAGSVAASLEQ